MAGTIGEREMGIGVCGVEARVHAVEKEMVIQTRDQRIGAVEKERAAGCGSAAEAHCAESMAREAVMVRQLRVQTSSMDSIETLRIHTRPEQGRGGRSAMKGGCRSVIIGTTYPRTGPVGAIRAGTQQVA